MAPEHASKVRRGGGASPLPDSPRSSLPAELALRASEVALAGEGVVIEYWASTDRNLRVRTAMVANHVNRAARLDRSRIRALPAVGLRNVVYVCARCSSGESHRQRSGGDENRKNSSHSPSLSSGYRYAVTTVSDSGRIGMIAGTVG